MNYRISVLNGRHLAVLRVIQAVSADIQRNKQSKKIMQALNTVYVFYKDTQGEIEAEIKKEKEIQKIKQEKAIEEAKIKAEQEKRKHYIQKGGGVKIIYLSRQESETIQKIAEALGIENLEEVGENEDGTEASPSWWGDTAF